jgi:hypothetical protein
MDLGNLGKLGNMDLGQLTNMSKSQFTFAKRDGQIELAIQLNNVGAEPRTLRLVVKDPASGVLLPASVGGQPIGDAVMVPGETIQQMLVDTTDAGPQVAIEVTKENGHGGISLRQKSSSSNGTPNNLIELLLK